QGQVKLPLLLQTPEELEELLELPKFTKYVRAYNSMFAFTSLGGKIDNMVNNGKGPYIFRLGGQNHHRIRSLWPPEGQPPKFAQLYIYDSQNEVANRMSAFSKVDGSSPLDTNIVEKLVRIFDINNEIMKLDELMTDLKGGHVFGEVRAFIYGLPHEHILIWLAQLNKLATPTDVDRLISAEIPDKKGDPAAYRVVSLFMMHGPSNSCMVDGNCSKHFPKQFNSETYVDENRYPEYLRRDDGKVIYKETIPLDN
ncbi:hypothetical protein RJ639_012633, partial [Escallonia herrerae]